MLPGQYLGYLDLFQLALHSASRRKQVFSLNQSGKEERQQGGGVEALIPLLLLLSGQPSTWNEIYGECITLIKSLVTKLGGQLQSQKRPAGSLIPSDIPVIGQEYI